MVTPRTVAPSIWRPLAEPLFRALWIASVASNVGTVMHDTAAGWLMASLSRSAILVALMQTASSLPMFLLSLPSGALADVLDRRRLLLVTQGWMLAAAGTLGMLTVLHLTTPGVLLALTFTMGLGNALNGPAWQSVTPELVRREELPTAVALGGAGYNLARAVGPAIAGFIIAAAGSGGVFLLNAASFTGVMGVLSRWQRPPRQSLSPAERVAGAMRAGTRYVRHSPGMRAVLARIGIFILCGSALWALLPVLVRHVLGLSSVGYGALLGCLGAGAVTGAVILPLAQERFTIDQVVGGGTALFAAATAALGTVRSPILIGFVMFAGGVAWLTVMSSLNLAAQTVLPGWVRARGLAVYLLVFQGGMAAGSAVWGVIANHAGIPHAFQYAAVGLALGLVAVIRFPLAAHAGQDLTPAMHWPTPTVAVDLDPDDGPVLITVRYQIDPPRAAEFAEAMRALGRTRRRDGAMRWGLFRDTADPDRYIETFVVESWAEHLRQHERVTVADQAIEERARACQVRGVEPVVDHYLYAYANGR